MLDRRTIQTFLIRAAPTLCGVFYIALIVRTALAWAPALDPAALWHDDIWVAVLTRMDSVVEMLRARIPVPPGYMLLSRLAGQTFADPELPFQITAFFAGLLCIPAIGLLVQRVTENRWAGLFGAALVSLNHWIGVYAVRVKPYTLDVLLITVLLLVGHAAISKPSSRRVLVLAIAAVLAVPFSFPSLLISGLLLLFSIHAGIRMRHADRTQSTRIIIYATGGIVLLGCWFLLDAQGKGNPNLKAYWAPYFALERTRPEAIRFLINAVVSMFKAAMPSLLGALWLLTIPSLVLMILSRKERVFGWMILLFYLAILSANILRIYPLGTPRLLLFTFPATVVLVCFGINRFREMLHLRDTWQAALALFVCLVAFALPVHPRYPGINVPPPVRALEQAANKDDTILLHPAAGRVVSYYGSWPIKFVKMPGRILSFSAVIDRENLILTKGTEVTIYDHVCDSLGDASPARVVYYGIDSIGSPEPGRMYYANAAIIDALANSGYVLETVIAEVPGTKVISFLRAETP